MEKASSIQHKQSVVSFFDHDLDWSGVYGRDLPKGFFSFEMIRRKNLVTRLIETVAGGQRDLNILDCGCGPGELLKAVEDRQFKVTGVDINFNYLKKALDGSKKGSSLAHADVEKLPFLDNSFDLVYCIGVIFYLDNDQGTIREISRILRPDGKLLLSMPNLFMINLLLDPYYYVSGWMKYVARKIGRGQSDEAFSTAKIRRYRFNKMKSICEEFGLKQVSSHCVSFGPLTFWRREIFPLSTSMKISDGLLNLSQKKFGRFLQLFANRWVVVFEKV